MQVLEGQQLGLIFRQVRRVLKGLLAKVGVGEDNSDVGPIFRNARR